MLFQRMLELRINVSENVQRINVTCPCREDGRLEGGRLMLSAHLVVVPSSEKEQNAR